MAPPAPQLPLLYTFRRCPYAIRARLALRQSGVEVAQQEVALRDKPAAMLALSPKGTVPVLHLPDGRVLDESLDIMRWALAQHDPAHWLSLAPLADMLALVARNDQDFKPLLDRYKYPERHPEHTQAGWRGQAMATFLDPLAQRLQGQPCLFGAQPCLADMAVLPFVRQFAQVDRAWWDQAAPPALRAWLQGLLCTPLFDAVMAKP